MAKWFQRVIGTALCTGLLSVSLASAIEVYNFGMPPTPMFAHTATH